MGLFAFFYGHGYAFTVFQLPGLFCFEKKQKAASETG